MIYKDILSAEIAKEVDTDHGIMRAYWETCKRLIETKTDRQELLRFLQHVGLYWGEFKMVEMKGDMIDAGLL